MKSPEAEIPPGATSSKSQDELTGLPFLRTWRHVYLLVFGCFMLWVLLLLALTALYS